MPSFEEIITYTVIIAAFAIAAIMIYKKIKNPLKACESCTKKNECMSCELLDLKKEIEKNSKKNNTPEITAKKPALRKNSPAE